MNLLSVNLPMVALLPFLMAPVAAYATRFHRGAAAWIAGITTLFALLLLAPAMPLPFAGETLLQTWQWIPAIGLHFSFRLHYRARRRVYAGFRHARVEDQIEPPAVNPVGQRSHACRGDFVYQQLADSACGGDSRDCLVPDRENTGC